jgi:starch phosphorylase
LAQVDEVEGLSVGQRNLVVAAGVSRDRLRRAGDDPGDELAGINLSELDGWWAEAYAPRFGWSLGANGENVSDEATASTLYEQLEREIVPAFYTRDADGTPAAWVERMRASMAELAPRFSTNRMLREYLEGYYLPAGEAVRARTARHCALARTIVAWQEGLREGWHAIRFDEPRVEAEGGAYRYTVRCHLGGVDPDWVRVELYADAAGAAPSERHPMERGTITDGGADYRATLRTDRPIGDYTARAVAYHPHATVPLEAAEITWQR